MIDLSKATPRPWVQFLDRDAETVEFLPAGQPGTTGIIVSIATVEGNANAMLVNRAVNMWRHPSQWRHRKRDTSYDVLTATAEAQCSTGPINEGDHVTVYLSEDGNWYVRKTVEFQDGRFERIE